MSNILTEKIIKCSGCGQALKIPNSRREIVKTVNCPKCHCPLVVNFIDESAPNNKPDETEDPDDGGTVYKTDPYVEFNGIKYYLKKDENVIGRRASTSMADIQIDSNDMYMGRHHAVITKKRDRYGNTVYSLKCKDAKNGLSVNNIPVGATEEVNLLNGANIRMGRTVIVFKQ